MARYNDAKKMKFVLMKEHPLLGYALCFMIGAYSAIMIDFPVVFAVIVLVISALFTIGFTIFRKKSWVFLLFVFISLGYILSNASIPKWYNEDYVPPEKCQIIGTVETVRDKGYASEYVLSDVSFGTKKIESKIIVKNISERNKIVPGQRIRFYATLEKPATAQQTGMFSEKMYYMTKGIQYTCTIYDTKIAVLKKAENSISINTRVQSQIYSRFNKNFSQPVLGMIYSLGTGNKNYMDKELYSQCSSLGISHIFAISGLHIGALLIIWEFFCKKTKQRFLVKILGSAILIFILYIIVGSRASLFRAIAMWALIVVYQYAGIKGDLIDFLSIAMIVLLFMNPLYVVDLGFILSVTCVGAIWLIYLPIAKKNKHKKLFRLYPVSMFVVSLSILSFSWIITAKAFGQVAIMSPIWNVIFVPITIVLLMLLMCYSIVFWIPLIRFPIIWAIDNLAKIIINLVKWCSKINIEIKTPSISFIATIGIVIALLLITDVLFKKKKKLRTVIGIATVVIILALSLFIPMEPKMEVFAGYDAPFVYIYENNKSILILNEDDGGIRRVLKDINKNKIDVFLYTGNDIEDLEELLSDIDGIKFKEIIIHEDLIEGNIVDNNYTLVSTNEVLEYGNLSFNIQPFRANKNAVTHYYADIKYYDRHFTYIDSLRLREGAIDKSETVICTSWTKQRIENLTYVNCKYVIMNSRDYLMDDLPVSNNNMTIPTYNINNSGSFTYFP